MKPASDTPTPTANPVQAQPMAPVVAQPVQAVPAAGAANNECNPDCGALCSDMMEALKTGLCDMPAVYKEFYATCPLQCSPLDQFDLALKAYSGHMWISFVYWIIFLIVYGSFGLLAYAIGSLIVNIILVWLSFVWVLTAVKRPEGCCCDRFVSMIILTVLIGINVVTLIFAMITCFQAMAFSGAFIVPALFIIWDISVSIPMLSYFIRSTQSLKQPSGAPNTVGAVV